LHEKAVPPTAECGRERERESVCVCGEGGERGGVCGEDSNQSHNFLFCCELELEERILQVKVSKAATLAKNTSEKIYYTCMYIYICIHICKCILTIHKYTYVYTHMCICYVYVCSYMYVYKSRLVKLRPPANNMSEDILYIDIYIYINMYVYSFFFKFKSVY